MKKGIWLFTMVLIIGIGLFGSARLFDIEVDDIINSINGYNFDKDDFTIVTQTDTHGGFNGDGTYCLVLDCSENREQAYKNLADWNELPLPKELEIIAYGGDYYDINYLKGRFPDEVAVPEIANGYYYFRDRHSESTNSEDCTDLLNRYSYNFDFAIYDADTDMLYYIKNDT